MKKSIFNIVTTVITLLTLVSCEKFLETSPIDSITSKNYYETEEQLNKALGGVYQILARIYADGFQGVMGLDADEGFYNRSQQTTGISVNLVTTTDTKISTTWSALYSGIERANLLLENLNKPSMNEKNRNVIRGEALFLRAYYYYLLVTHWGDVPLVLESNKSVSDVHKVRASSVEIYEQIIRDMTVAEELVKPVTEMTNAGKVNKSAVRGILARVCLQMAGEPLKDESKYEQAKYWAEKVVDDGYHALNPDYKQVFVNLIQDKYDLKESIWEVEFYGNTNDSYNASGRVGINNGITYYGSNNEEWGYCYGFVAVNPTLYYSYGKGDLRRDWAIGRYSLSSDYTPVVTYFAALPSKQDASSHTVGKFRREYELSREKTQNGNSTNFPILRFSDVLLMFAEADVQASKSAPSEKAIEALNKVRRRAYGKMLTHKELVDTLILNQAGTGYKRIPDIRIIGGGGSQAKAVFRSMTSAGGLSDFVIVNKGSAYTSVPTVEVGNLWKAQTNYQVGDTVAYLKNLYAVNVAGISTNTPPTHTSGGVTIGARFLRVGDAVNMTATITNLNNVNADATINQVLSYQNFMKLIKAERSRELSFEGCRKRDLVRWGDYLDAMQQSYIDLQGISRSWLGRAGQNTTERDVLWPIPSSETTTNILMTQNKGW
ncbi:RagB/SusD family nutrient uptake outer membrane protein [Pseudopedobacter beijingensis]|uniref:RagB/SusD family nutrient uptake outer membrane protein n=1 Tax=Pseudopedobacter beijingensis TaxID=1207056 RepID=A0ABW4IEJ8_9SPHI